MYRLPPIILILWGFALPILGQSPHGEDLAIDCAACHNPAGWSVDYAEVEYDHDETTFPLEGTHELTDCKLCHTTLVFNEAPMECVSCHTDVHSMSVGNDCARCHTSESWLVDDIPELHEENGFPLIGAHANLSCVECHLAETVVRFDRIGNECISCHREDYLTAENPNHETAGYSTQCTDCHNPLGFGWEADPIAHDFFPLTGGHDIQDCNECHTTGNFSDASPECVSCHQEDYNASVNPSHNSLGLSTDCKTCHTIEPDWQPARFDDHNSYYALNGAHAEIANDCFVCHNGDYNNTPNTCYECHQSDYNNADDPNHVALNFSMDCIECHTEDEWEPSTFVHDGFPIFNGSHAGEWDTCTDCHTDPNNFEVFSCTICHTRADTDDEHDDVNGYVYNSIDCLQCHPDGEE